MTLWSRLMAGYRAFRNAIMVADLLEDNDFTDWGNRQARYAVDWAIFENTCYQDAHNWAPSYRHAYGLYREVRSIYGPAHEMGSFWQTHLLGGVLDPEALEEGAIPIVTDNEALRPAIAELWKWSKWQTQKDVMTLQGCILGDVGLRVVDSVKHERVYLELVYPGIIKDIDKDPFGNIKGYVIEEQRANPKGGGSVTYTEQVTRSGINVVYETFLNHKPYAWGDQPERWTLPYGFVPMVHVMHNDVGLDFGWSELHPMRSKVMEIDDLASMLTDQLRKAVRPKWFLTGMKPSDLKTSPTAATEEKPHPDREEIPAVWTTSPDAKADAMVADVDYEGVLLHISNILGSLEKEFPELNKDIGTSSGDASGRALRVARQRVTAKVLQRRVNYDDGLVKAQQMAIAIGGYRGYEGYKGFNLDSYAKGTLDHTIASRSVFDEDPLDQTEISASFWEAANKAKAAGVPLKGFLLEAGWSDERIAKLDIQEVEDEDSSIDQ